MTGRKRQLLVDTQGVMLATVVQPRRWVVERTCGWLGRCQRLSKDYEAYPVTSETWIALAMCALLLRRLCPSS